jgi:hypothetical protein
MVVTPIAQQAIVPTMLSLTLNPKRKEGEGVGDSDFGRPMASSSILQLTTNQSTTCFPAIMTSTAWP